MTTQYDHWIGGRSTRGSTDERFVTHNPASGEDVSSIALGGAHEVALAVEAAAAAASSWRRLKPVERARLMLALSARILAEQDRLAAIKSSCPKISNSVRLWPDPLRTRRATFRSTCGSLDLWQERVTRDYLPTWRNW